MHNHARGKYVQSNAAADTGVYVPPESKKTLSTSLCTKVVAALCAVLSSSSYKIIILPGLFFCSAIQSRVIIIMGGGGGGECTYSVSTVWIMEDTYSRISFEK